MSYFNNIGGNNSPIGLTIPFGRLPSSPNQTDEKITGLNFPSSTQFQEDPDKELFSGMQELEKSLLSTASFAPLENQPSLPDTNVAYQPFYIEFPKEGEEINKQVTQKTSSETKTKTDTTPKKRYFSPAKYDQLYQKHKDKIDLTKLQKDLKKYESTTPHDTPQVHKPYIAPVTTTQITAPEEEASETDLEKEQWEEISKLLFPTEDQSVSTIPQQPFEANTGNSAGVIANNKSSTHETFFIPFPKSTPSVNEKEIVDLTEESAIKRQSEHKTTKATPNKYNSRRNRELYSKFDDVDASQMYADYIQKTSGYKQPTIIHPNYVAAQEVPPTQNVATTTEQPPAKKQKNVHIIDLS